MPSRQDTSQLSHPSRRNTQVVKGSTPLLATRKTPEKNPKGLDKTNSRAYKNIIKHERNSELKLEGPAQIWARRLQELSVHI